MKRQPKRLLAFIMAVTLLVSSVYSPVSIYATETDTATEVTTEMTESETEEISTEVTEEITVEVTTEATTDTTTETTTEEVTEAETTEDITTEEVSEEVSTEETTESEIITPEESEIIEPTDGGVDIYYDADGNPQIDVSDELVDGILQEFSASLSDSVQWTRLTKGANAKNRNGKKIYNTLKKNCPSLEDIAAFGDNYKKAYEQGKKKSAMLNQTCTDSDGNISEYPEYWFEMCAENTVGSFITEHFKDAQGITHGNTHLIKRLKEYTTVKMSIYATTDNKDTDGDGVPNGYYFVYITGEKQDEVTVDENFEPILTYCIEYGAPIKSKNDNSSPAQDGYDDLTKEQRYKIAAAAYFGPHYDIDDVEGKLDDEFLWEEGGTRKEKLTKNDTLGGGQILGKPGADGSYTGWSKETWARHIASQLYIWTVQTEQYKNSDDKKQYFNHTEAKSTAKQMDAKYGTSIYDYYIDTKEYVETCRTIPSFSARCDEDGNLLDENGEIKEGATPPIYKMKWDAASGYSKTITDTENVLKTVNITNPSKVTVASSELAETDRQKLEDHIKSNISTYLSVSGKKLTINIPQTDIDALSLTTTGNFEVTIRFKKNDKVPVDDLGAIFHTSAEAQNMVEAVIDPYEYYGVLSFNSKATSVANTQIEVHKYIDNTIIPDKDLSGVKFYVMTTNPYAAVYNPADDTFADVSTAENYAKAYLYGGKLFPHTAESLASFGGGAYETVYGFAYDPAGTSSVGASFSNNLYTLTTNSAGNAATSELLLLTHDTTGSQYSDYLLFEYYAPSEVEQPHWESNVFKTDNWTPGTYGPTATFSGTDPNMQAGYISDDIPNTAIKGGIAVYKYAWRADLSTEEYINGVQFKIYTDEACTNELATITTGKHYDADTATETETTYNGFALIDNLEPGTYYVKEVPPASPLYTVDSQVHAVTVTGGVTAEATMIGRQNTTAYLPVINVPHMAQIQIKKSLNTATLPAGFVVDMDAIDLSDAEFTIYAGEDILDLAGRTLYQEGTEITTIFTDKNGIAKTDPYSTAYTLRPGKYIVKETKAPKGFKINTTPFEVTVDASDTLITPTVDAEDMGYHPQVLLDDNTEVKEDMQLMNIDIIKKGAKLHNADKETAQEVNLAGAGFSLYNLTKMEKAGIVIPKDSTGSYDIKNFEFLPVHDQYQMKLIESTGATEIVTDANGAAKSDKMLPVGQFALVETTTPAGFNPCEPILVELPGTGTDGEWTRGITNYTDVMGSIRIEKKGCTVINGAPTYDNLAGAGFSLYDLDKIVEDFYVPQNAITGEYDVTQLDFILDAALYEPYRMEVTSTSAKEMFTDTDGKCESILLPEGDYVLVETTTPEGFKQMDNMVVHLPATNGQGNYAQYSLNAVNYKNTGYPIYINKIGKRAEDGKQITEPLPGAGFTLYDLLRLEASGVTIPKTPEGEYDIADFDFNPYSDFRVSLADGDTKEVFTSTDGKVSTLSVPIGKYALVETTVPKGYLKADNQLIVVNEVADGEDGSVSAEVINEEEDNAKIFIVKTGTANANGETKTFPLAGAGFAVYNIDRMVADGIAVPQNGNGEYAVTEFDFLDAIYYDYRMNISDNPAEPTIIYSGTDGKCNTTKLPKGNYAVVEVVVPDGFRKSDNKVVNIPTDEVLGMVSLTIDNKQIFGRIKIYKTGEVPVRTEKYKTKYQDFERIVFEEKPVKGIEFTIYDATGNIVDVVTTTGEEYTTSKELPLGDYKVKETNTTAGLVTDTTTYSVSLTLDKNEEVIEAKVTVLNKAMGSEIAVYKIVESIKTEDGQEFTTYFTNIPGIIFGVFANQDLLDYNGNVLVTTGTCVGVAKTDDNGVATIKEALLPGEYYYQELYTPDSYVMDTTKHPFTLTLESNLPTERIEVNKEIPAINELKKAKVQLLKVDAADKDTVLEGATFGLYRQDDDLLVGEYTTDEEGKIIIEEMPYGKWYFLEHEAPEGYNLSDKKYEFEVTTDTQNTTIEITATNVACTKVQLLKISENESTPLKGAVFGLYISETDEKIGEYTTNKEGLIEVENLDMGKYYFRELKAPKGYILKDDKYEFTLNDTHTLVYLVAKNKERPSLGLADYVSANLFTVAFTIIISGLALAIIALVIYMRRRKYNLQ